MKKKKRVTARCAGITAEKPLPHETNSNSQEARAYFSLGQKVFSSQGDIKV
jgi:hypothetical protein